MKIYTHPTCSTCKKVLKWLDQNHYTYTTEDIRQTQPNYDLFKTLLDSGVKITKMMNTSGQLYRKLLLKDKIGTMSNHDIAILLSSEGMLIKRPVIIDGEKISFGSKDSDLEEMWGIK